MPQDVVDAFAEEWGFIKTRSHVVNSIKELREFTSHIAKVGEWDGEAVEGFVVRTTYSAEDGAKGKSPYTSGSSFFFKIKIDEPYMMYRDWREVTKKLLSINGPLSAACLSKVKMKRKETRVYANWVIDEIQKDKSQFDEYTRGHGIIATREKFLTWYEEQKARGIPVKGEKDEKPVVQTTKGKVLIAPIAIPGCGMFPNF
jgi:tRNA ligase